MCFNHNPANAELYMPPIVSGKYVSAIQPSSSVADLKKNVDVILQDLKAKVCDFVNLPKLSLRPAASLHQMYIA